MTHYVQVPLSTTTYQRIKRLALKLQRDEGETIADYLTKALAAADDPPTPQDALVDEVAAFEKIKPELLETHPNEFVAIYQGEIVGFDQDEINLIRRVYKQYGPAPCYVERIVPETPRTVRITSRWRQKQ